jgi:Sulfotransferase family
VTSVRRYRDGFLALARPRAARPERPDSPPPACPPGWSVGPPNFVGVGTARSGTTWWDSLVHEHPDVVRAEGVPKEVHFFDRFWEGTFSEADAGRYHALFPRPDGKRTGEWTPGYMLDFWTPPLLRRAAPHAKLLVLLRDPVERFRSGLTLTENRLTLGWSARAAANGGFQRGIYADQLLRLWAIFPREQVLVLQFERCVRDPRAGLRRTFEFLGLDAGPATTIDVGRKVNESRAAKIDLSENQRAALVRRYEPENRRLAELVPDLDLSLWQAPRTKAGA